MKLPLFSAAVVLGILSLGTGPARAPAAVIETSGQTLWLKADAITGATDGQALSSWVDSSGGAAPTSTSDFKPTYQTGVRNGQPVVRFTANHYLPPNVGSEFYTTARTGAEVFIVVNPTYNAGGNWLYGGGGAGYRFHVPFVRSSFGNVNEIYTESPAADHITRGDSGSGVNTNPPAGLNIWRVNDYATTAGFVATIYQDGYDLGWESGMNGQLPGLPNVSRIGHAYRFAGDIAEVITYSSKLSTTDRNLVNNYLSAKYATPLAASVDKYAGDTAGKGDYDRNVFGIGEESDGTVSTRGTDGLVLTEANLTLDIGEYLLAGNKVAANSWTTNDLSAGGGARWNRVWYVDKTGTLDATLTFDFTAGGMGSLDPLSRYQLLYSTSNVFSFAALALTPTVAGNQVSFTVPSALLQDGYYTLLNIPEPSTVLLWLAGAGLLFWRRGRG